MENSIAEPIPEVQATRHLMEQIAVNWNMVEAHERKVEAYQRLHFNLVQNVDFGPLLEIPDDYQPYFYTTIITIHGASGKAYYADLQRNDVFEDGTFKKKVWRLQSLRAFPHHEI